VYKHLENRTHLYLHNSQSVDKEQDTMGPTGGIGMVKQGNYLRLVYLHLMRNAGTTGVATVNR